MNFDDENGLSIEGFEDDDGDGDWEMAKLTPEQLASMTPEQKLASAPETIGDLERSNLSTVPDKDYLVLYRDENDKAIKVFNLLTAQELSLREAGIFEINMKDGRILEMASFESVQEAINYAYLERGASGSTREVLQNEEKIDKYNEFFGINGSNFLEKYAWRYVGGNEVIFDKNNRSNIAFGVFTYSILNGSLVFFYNGNLETFENIYINESGETVSGQIGRGTVTAPIIENQ